MEEPKKIDVDVCLKPCPFCGSEPEVRDLERQFDRYECLCMDYDCDAIVATYGSTPEEAAEKWNRRAGNEPNEN